MCGRFSVNKEQVEHWLMEDLDLSFVCETNPDLKPTQTVATIIDVNNSLQQLNTSWGIKPGWSKKLIINAQGETASTKKTFTESFRLRRCLVPCSGWYEWRNEGDRKKQKYFFSHAEKLPLLMAGIWFETEGIPQLVTLTSPANKICAEFHQRMPVLIMPENMNYWFNSSAESVQPLLEAIKIEQLSVVSC